MGPVLSLQEHRSDLSLLANTAISSGSPVVLYFNIPTGYGDFTYSPVTSIFYAASTSTVTTTTDTTITTTSTVTVRVPFMDVGKRANPLEAAFFGFEVALRVCQFYAQLLNKAR